MGHVTENVESAKGPEAEGASTEEFKGVECDGEGVEANVEKFRLLNLKTGSGLGLATGTGNASLSFTALLPGPTDCVFTATNQQFTYSTTAMTNSAKFTNAALVGNPPGCGNATFSGDFALTTSGTATSIEIT